MCGLCGNFDGIQNNDFTSSNLKVEEDPVDFGNSWKVSPQCADTRKVGLGSLRGRWVVGVNCSGGGARKEGLGSFWVDCLGPSVYSCLDPQVPLDSSPATCHNNIMKQTMVDSSCRILTSDIFWDCNKLVRAVGGILIMGTALEPLKRPASDHPIAPFLGFRLGNRKVNQPSVRRAKPGRSFSFYTRHSSSGPSLRGRSP